MNALQQDPTKSVKRKLQYDGCRNYTSFETEYNQNPNVRPFAGVMFRMRGRDRPIDIMTLELDVLLDAASDLHVEVFHMPGNFYNFVTDPSSWKQIASTTLVPRPSGNGAIIPVGDFLTVPLQPNAVGSFYVTMKGPWIDNTVNAMDKTGSEAAVAPHFYIDTGAGLNSYKFPAEGVDTTTFPKFSGTVHYTISGGDCIISNPGYLTTKMEYYFMANVAISDGIRGALVDGISSAIEDQLVLDEILNQYKKNFGLKVSPDSAGTRPGPEFQGECPNGWNPCPTITGDIQLEHTSDLPSGEVEYQLYSLSKNIEEAVRVDLQQFASIVYIGYDGIAATYDLTLRNVPAKQMTPEQEDFFAARFKFFLNTILPNSEAVDIQISEQSVTSRRRLRSSDSRNAQQMADLNVKGMILAKQFAAYGGAGFVKPMQEALGERGARLRDNIFFNLILPRNENEGVDVEYFGDIKFIDTSITPAGPRNFDDAVGGSSSPAGGGSSGGSTGGGFGGTGEDGNVMDTIKDGAADVIAKATDEISKMDSQTWVYVGAGLGAFVLLVGALIACCIWQRKKKEAERLAQRRQGKSRKAMSLGLTQDETNSDEDLAETTFKYNKYQRVPKALSKKGRSLGLHVEPEAPRKSFTRGPAAAAMQTKPAGESEAPRTTSRGLPAATQANDSKANKAAPKMGQNNLSKQKVESEKKQAKPRAGDKKEEVIVFSADSEEHSESQSGGLFQTPYLKSSNTPKTAGNAERNPGGLRRADSCSGAGISNGGESAKDRWASLSDHVRSPPPAQRAPRRSDSFRGRKLEQRQDRGFGRGESNRGGPGALPPQARPEPRSERGHRRGLSPEGGPRGGPNVPMRAASTGAPRGGGPPNPPTRASSTGAHPPRRPDDRGPARAESLRGPHGSSPGQNCAGNLQAMDGRGDPRRDKDPRRRPDEQRQPSSRGPPDARRFDDPQRSPQKPQRSKSFVDGPRRLAPPEALQRQRPPDNRAQYRSDPRQSPRRTMSYDGPKGGPESPRRAGRRPDGRGPPPQAGSTQDRRRADSCEGPTSRPGDPGQRRDADPRRPGGPGPQRELAPYVAVNRDRPYGSERLRPTPAGREAGARRPPPSRGVGRASSFDGEFARMPSSSPHPQGEPRGGRKPPDSRPSPHSRGAPPDRMVRRSKSSD